MNTVPIFDINALFLISISISMRFYFNSRRFVNYTRLKCSKICDIMFFTIAYRLGLSALLAWLVDAAFIITGE